jgi:hypothetical protein
VLLLSAADFAAATNEAKRLVYIYLAAFGE